MTLKTTEYKGITLLKGRSAHPHWENNTQTLDGLMSHEEEHTSFMEFLEVVENKEDPLMIEIGPWWSFWSLCFRQKFPHGSNFIIEIGKRHLDVALTNFKLNGYDVDAEWGGFFLDHSNTVVYPDSNYNYNLEDLLENGTHDPENVHFNESLEGDMVGPELDFVTLYNEKQLDNIDVLHVDIQGSEYPLMRQLTASKILNKIQSIIVATHSPNIHNAIKYILETNSFTILKEGLYGTVGGDGMFVATKRKQGK